MIDQAQGLQPTDLGLRDGCVVGDVEIKGVQGPADQREQQQDEQYQDRLLLTLRSPEAYENDGDESFTARDITTSADGAYSVFAADVDGDGDTDVLSASSGDGKVGNCGEKYKDRQDV